MKKLLLSLLVAVFVLPVFSATFVSSDGKMDMSAEVLQLSKKTVKAKNKINIRTKLTENEVLDVRCNLFMLQLMNEGGVTTDNIKNCSFSENVIIKYQSSKESKAQCLGRADSAFYDGRTGILVLTGNVKIDYFDNNGEKISATGSKAVINFNENLKENDVIFSVEGDSKNNAEIIRDGKNMYEE
ncbi:MAG: hypothetical protein KBT47_07455 [Armatimonadetes bacterium]|nr:hypothetical protein [Candidatus Hippobium faecium]